MYPVCTDRPFLGVYWFHTVYRAYRIAGPLVARKYSATEMGVYESQSWPDIISLFKTPFVEERDPGSVFL
jgi:hypothetical protein